MKILKLKSKFWATLFTVWISKISHVPSFYSEAVTRKFSVKKVFLDISQNPKENTCATVSFLIKKWLWHKYFPVNFVKFLRTTLVTEHFCIGFCLLHIKTVNGVASWYILVLHRWFYFIPCVSFLSIFFFFFLSYFVSSVTCWGIVVSLAILKIMEFQGASCYSFI